MAAATKSGLVQRRRIIERPRLSVLLDDSGARVLVLTAPAGYGKSTLAGQWIDADGRSGAWFRARPSSTDVAALALDVARTAAAIVPGCDERLREHLRAVAAPGERPDVLGELVGEDLAAWPSNAWLVIDEYEEIATSRDAERFIEVLVESSPVQLLVASRQRPSWATQRRILLGELLEITHSELAMTESEAAEVLAGRSGPSRSSLLALAGGWPAAIALASVSGADLDRSGAIDPSELHESLYRFFAEEIFRTFDDDVQRGLVVLSIAPVLSRHLAVELLGDDVSRQVCALAIDIGVMAERGDQLEFHPLARSFLNDRAAREHPTANEAAETCVAHYRERRDWAAALDLITWFGLRERLVPTLDAALDKLLDTGQLSSLEEWCESAQLLGIDESCVALARAEIALRRARLTEAQTHGEAAAGDGSPYAFRGLCVAGRAAHLASREEEAVELYRRAEAAAATVADRREAEWAGATCLFDLEAPEAEARLIELRRSLIRSSPHDVVRCAAAGLSYGFRFGALDLAEADRAHELLGAVASPLVRAAFQCNYSVALSLSARYEAGLTVSESALHLVRGLRIDFALPYMLHARATALAGLRDWRGAERDIESALSATRATRDSYGQHICLALEIRLLVQQGRHESALAVEVPALAHSLRSGLAEANASRAFALAAASRMGEAVVTIDEVRGLSSAIEPTVLISVVDTIVALKSGDRSAYQQAAALADLALTRGAQDLLVAAYRSTPELLGLLLRAPERRDEMVRLLARVGDLDLAEGLGQSVALDDPAARLSPREREVFRLLQDGMTNAQIAATLVLSEATVKVHVHKILEKLGFDNRNAIAFQAILTRRTQATSAIDETEGTLGSSVL
jgi:LuxR family transcriptional regulator, maltose regulon positive regulatory protein